MQLAQAYRLKGDKAAADKILERLKPLNRLYNLIIRIKNPKGENLITPLAELGSACEDAGLLAEADGWYRLAISIDPLDSAAQKGLHRIKGIVASQAPGTSAEPRALDLDACGRQSATSNRAR
jgi:hypothetical protein